MTQTKVAGPLDKYFADVSAGMKLLGQSEIPIFDSYVAIETKLIRVIAINRGLPTLVSALKEAGVTKKDIPTSIDKINERAIIAVRTTEFGRRWLEEGIEAALKTSRTRDKVRRLCKNRTVVKNKIVAANLRLVISVSKRFTRMCNSLTLADLIQEGNIGLMKAAERFDPSRGNKFSTYAVWWIRHHIKRATCDKEPTIRLPVHVAEANFKLMRVESEHLARTGQTLDVRGLAKHTGMSCMKVMNVIDARHATPVCLDAMVGDSTPVHELIADPSPNPYDNLEALRDHHDVVDMLEILTPMEATVIRARFGLNKDDDMTLQEIATGFGLSRERIRQIEVKALSKLRACFVASAKMSKPGQQKLSKSA